MKKFSQLGVSFLLFFILIAGFSNITPASAADAAQFYKGKVLEFIVPYSPGGGTDVYARMVGPYIQRYLGATVVIKNMPGAGGIYGKSQAQWTQNSHH